MIDLFAKIVLTLGLAIMIGVCIWYMIKTYKNDLRVGKLRILLLEDECEKRGILTHE